MSLRDQCVEAGAARLWNELPRYGLMYPECERTARHVLDAILDTLEANADEWQTKIVGASHALAAPSKAELGRAIAALRDTETAQTSFSKTQSAVRDTETGEERA